MFNKTYDKIILYVYILNKARDLALILECNKYIAKSRTVSKRREMLDE